MSIEQNDIVVSSWSELCDRLYDNSWQDDIHRFRSNYAFRGISDKDYSMITSFRRVCGKNPEMEYHLMRNFCKYAREDHLPPGASDWRWITLAQHHGLPTRLLDWTYSPFVAAHFATENLKCYDRDAAIWFVDFVKVNQMLPDPLRSTLDEIGSNAFTMEMLERAIPRIQYYDKLTEQDLVLFLEPPSMDSRIVNQFALFSVMSNATTSLDNWLLQHPEVYGRVIIPKELKWEIRDKLDQANITERMLFPGLDGLAAWLTRHYTPVPEVQK